MSSVARWLRRRVGGAEGGGVGAVEALRETWSRYPADWQRDADINRGAETLGEEWGGPWFADAIVDELVAPYLGLDVDVLDLGCGGGKFSQRLAPRCRSLICADISPEMIEHTRTSLARQGLDENVSYRVLNGVDFSGVADASVDFVFSYDALLHVQPQNVYSYMLDVRRILRDDGVFMLHQINLASIGGMRHFLAQFRARTWTYGFDDLRRRGHIYFMSGDQMLVLGDHAGLALDRFGPPEVPRLRAATGDRDLFGFFRNRRSRLRAEAAAGHVELVRASGHEQVYAVIEGRRTAVRSSGQLERAGLRWEDVRELGGPEFDGIPEGEPLEPWE